MRTVKKRRDQRNAPTHTRSTLFVPPLLIALSFILGAHFAAPISKIALFSASLTLSQGTVQMIQSDLRNDEKAKSAPVEVQKAPVNAEEEPAAPAASTAITDTPQDILDRMRAAESAYQNAQHAGVIIEKQYDAQNANAVFKNITVRNTTPSHSIDIQGELQKNVSLSVKDKAEPTVLIFHTHTTECYETLNLGWYKSDYVTRSNDPAVNMVRVGTAICEELEKMGVGVIHDTEIHDAKYTGAYDRSRESIERIMKENPSIQIVLDIHRDAIKQSDGTRIKPTATVGGKKTAQVMIIAGCEDGKVTSFPSWEENLVFALKLQQTAENKYPGLMRPILFSARKYNMDVTPCSLLLEVGSDSNTLEEAVYAGRLIGTALGDFILQYAK